MNQPLLTFSSLLPAQQPPAQKFSFPEKTNLFVAHFVSLKSIAGLLDGKMKAAQSRLDGARII